MINSLGESADAYYYTGVKALFENDGLSAEWAFQNALLLGYHDQDKINQAGLLQTSIQLSFIGLMCGECLKV